MSARGRAPFAHMVRVRARVGLDRGRYAAIRVAFAQHRAHRAAEHLGVAGLDLLLILGLWLVREVRDLEALRLQLGDRAFELVYGGADVRQLDDVGGRQLGQLGELGQRIRYPLPLVQVVREAREDARWQCDVALLDTDSLPFSAFSGQEALVCRFRARRPPIPV
jgi:hypothetical protein